MGARFYQEFSGPSVQESAFIQNLQDAPHGSAIFFFKIFRTFGRTMKFRGCSAREGDVLQNFQDAPHGGAIFVNVFRILRAGARL